MATKIDTILLQRILEFVLLVESIIALTISKDEFLISFKYNIPFDLFEAITGTLSVRTHICAPDRIELTEIVKLSLTTCFDKEMLIDDPTLALSGHGKAKSCSVLYMFSRQ